MKDSKKRVYNTENRDIKAAQTKSHILESAKELFKKEGFDRVTISQLAKAAAVSMPTIYAVFKSKRGVLQALIDEALPSQEFTELVDHSMYEKDAKTRLRITAKLSRKIYEAEKELIDIIRGTLIVAPELKELEQQREKRRYERQEEYVKKMMDENVLAKGLTLEKARDILWSLTGRDMYRMLVIERKWASEDYEKWLAEILISSLLK